PWVGSMDISSDGSSLAAASDDSPIAILWSTSDRKHPKLLGKIHNPRRFSSLAISPDGKTLATGTNNGNLELWDIPTRQRIGESLPQHTGVVNKVVFSVDGKRLASAGSDGRLSLLDVSINSWRERACTIANRNLTPDEWNQFLHDETFKQRCPDFLMEFQTRGE